MLLLKSIGNERLSDIQAYDQEPAFGIFAGVYAKRWQIENKIAEFVSFFNINALSSPLMVKIHFDIFWTVIAATLYHSEAQDLPRFEKCQAKTIFRFWWIHYRFIHPTKYLKICASVLIYS